MKNAKTLLIAASVAFCAGPHVAVAQEADEGFVLEEAPEKEPIAVTTNTVELGAGWLSRDSFKFGEYSGHEDEGPFAIGNIDILQRAPYDGDSTRYWELEGTNLGIESRSVRGAYGHQGLFEIFGEYDQIPHFALDDAETPFIGAGGTNLTLPAGWVAGANTQNLTQLTASLRAVEIETERQRYGGGFSWNLAENWELAGSYRREDKDGLETIAGIFGSSGGNPRSAILPKPIDYTTHESDLSLSFSGERLQAQLGYHLSQFDPKKDSLIWSNPYTANAAWDPSQSFASGGQGRLALEPDNNAHLVTLSGGYMIDPTTRVAGNFSYGRMLQDEDFLPYTINPNLTGSDGVSAPAALPRDSLEGDVTTLRANLSVSARPLPKANLKGEYTFDMRDDETPHDVFLTIPADVGFSGAGVAGADQRAVDGDRARINRTYSRLSHKLELDGGYQVLPSLNIGLGYDFETIDRDVTEVEFTYEHTGRIKAKYAPSPLVSGSVSYAFSDRDGSEYESNLPFLLSHSPEHIAGAAEADLFEQNPFLRKYYIADRRRQVVNAGVTINPHDQVTVGLGGSYSTSDYHNTVVGLVNQTYGSATFDATFAPSERVTLSGFFTYETMDSDQVGYQRGGAAIVPSTVLDPALFWEETIHDRGYNAGLEVEWAAIEDRLDVFFDYTYSRTVTEFDIESGLANLPLPNLTTTMHAFGVRGDVNVTPALVVRLGYRFESFDTKDFALDGVNEAITGVIGLGNSSRDYDIHLVGASVVFSF